MSLVTRRAIYGKMAGDSTLTNLLGTAATGFTKPIYYQQAPAAAVYPFVVFSKQSGTPTYSMAQGGAPFDAEVWLIKGVDRSTTADAVEAVASRLDALLTDGSLSISGRTQMYLRRESDVDYLETDENVVYHHAGSLYRLISQPS